MTDTELFNTPLAVSAEDARQARDGDPQAGTVKVTVGDAPVSVAGEVHKPGATFTAPEDAVRDAVARGLVVPVAPSAAAKRTRG